MSRLRLALEQIGFARNYTLRLLENITVADWFRQPKEGVTHVAWQVGHLAMAQYYLGLLRVRGTKPEDAGLISERFLAQFGRDSVPDADASKYPQPPEIRAVLDRVHARFLEESRTWKDEEMDAPVLKPHPLVKTKLWSLLWCSQHEILHAGQIGLLRRLFGQKALW